MSAREDNVDERPRKRPRKGIFSFTRTDGSSSTNPPERDAAPGSTSASDRSIWNRKDNLYNLSKALELLRSVGEGTEILAPIKAICGGLKVLVDTAQAVQQNDEDIQEIGATLRLHLSSLEQQDETFSAIQSKDAKIFVELLRKYIEHLSKIEEVLNVRNSEGKSPIKGLLRKSAMVYSVGEDIKGYRRDLDECLRVFMNSVTSFIAHQALLLRNDITEMRMRDEEKKANDALSQLPCADARGNSHNSCLEGTRMDILKHITEWATGPGAKPIFCLVDQAGTGKSTISVDMAQTWEKKGFTVARFFFSLPNSVTNGTDLATTFARDLGDCSPTLRSLILEAIDNHPNTTGRSIQEKLEWFVLTPLKRRRESYSDVLARIRQGMRDKSYTKPLENPHHDICEMGDIKTLERSYRDALERAGNKAGDEACSIALENAYKAYTEELVKVYAEALVRPPIIVVDALDECSVVDRGIFIQSVLGFLEEAARAGSHPLKLFITSRPDDDIVSQIHDPRFNHLIQEADFGMVLGKTSSNDDDIALYAKNYLELILNSSEIHRFVARAKGLFIWASTARAFLKDALDPSACFEDLISENITVAPLKSLYDKILRSAMDRVGHHQLGPLKKVLQGICVTKEPISVDSMDELLGLRNGVALRVVERLRSVLSDGMDGKVVRVLHPTFIEYFKARSQPDDLLFSDEEAETQLAGGCLNVLCSGQLHYDICNLGQSPSFARHNWGIEDLEQRLQGNITPGLRYAAVHGLSHVALCVEHIPVLKMLETFFKSNLLHWIELMSLLGKVDHLRLAVHHLKTRIEDGIAHSAELLMDHKKWCEEVQDLIHPFQAAIEHTAMQIYFSALPFAPPTSYIAGVYHRKFMDKVPKVLRGHWSTQPHFRVLAGHEDGISCLSFSPDDRWIASGSLDATVRLWDVATGAAVGAPLDAHMETIRCVSFSPDGHWIASGSDDGTVRLWDVATRAEVGKPLSPPSIYFPPSIYCLSFSPDGRWIALGCQDGTLRLWEVATGAAGGRPLSGHTTTVNCLSFSPGNHWLASGSEDGAILLWDVAAGAEVGRPLLGRSPGVCFLSFYPGAQWLSSRSRDGTSCLWEITTGAAVGDPLVGHARSVDPLSVSLDGRWLASGSPDGMIRLCEITTSSPVGEPLAGHTNWVSCLCFSPDGQWLASGSSDCTVRLWDATTGVAVCEPLFGHTDHVRSLAFSPDGRWIASGSLDATVRLWDVATGAAVGVPLAAHTEPISRVSFSPDGQWIASGSVDGTIHLRDAASGTVVIGPLTGHTNWVSCLCFSPDGRWLASGSYLGTLCLWDVATGAAAGEPLPQDCRMESLSFHIHDDSLLLAINDGFVVYELSPNTADKLYSGLKPSELPVIQSRALVFDPTRLDIWSPPILNFRIPYSFNCCTFSTHRGKAAYGGGDGSVIIVDCSHLLE